MENNVKFDKMKNKNNINNDASNYRWEWLASNNSAKHEWQIYDSDTQQALNESIENNLNNVNLSIFILIFYLKKLIYGKIS